MLCHQPFKPFIEAKLVCIVYYNKVYKSTLSEVGSWHKELEFCAILEFHGH